MEISFIHILLVKCITVENVRDEIQWINAFILGWATETAKT